MYSFANILTATNLFFGCLAIRWLYAAEYKLALYCLLLASLADFLDGFVARKLHQTSDIGKELDSLADVVSFGVAPAVIAFQLLRETGCLGYPVLANLSFLLAVFSAFRLARFNVESSGHNAFFSGLPAPAMALFYMGLLAFFIDKREWHSVLFNFWVVSIVLVVFCWLLVSRIRVIKIFLHAEWLRKKGFFLLAALVCLLLWKWIGPLSLSLAVVVHIALSIFQKREKGNV